MGVQLYRQYNRDFYPPKEIQRSASPQDSVYFYGGNAADSAKYMARPT